MICEANQQGLGYPDLSFTQALFSSQKVPKNFQDFPSHRILRHIHETLDIDKNKN